MSFTPSIATAQTNVPSSIVRLSLSERAVHILPSTLTAPVAAILSIFSITVPVCGRIPDLQHFFHKGLEENHKREGKHEKRRYLEPQGEMKNGKHERNERGRNKPYRDESERRCFKNDCRNGYAEPYPRHYGEKFSHNKISPPFLSTRRLRAGICNHYITKCVGCKYIVARFFN